jgi:hypothetical protein
MQEWAGKDATAQKRWDRELAAYADAKRQGIQPDSTSLGAVRDAVDLSNEGGVAYDARKIARTKLETLR